MLTCDIAGTFGSATTTNLLLQNLLSLIQITDGNIAKMYQGVGGPDMGSGVMYDDAHPAGGCGT